jgi:small-conductance mechanosensitive channel
MNVLLTVAASAQPYTLWQYPIEIGELRFTPLSIIIGLVLFVVLAIATKIIRNLLRMRVLPRVGLSYGAAAAVSSLAGYGFLLIGALVIMPVMIQGFNLNTLSVILGAISFGIGFGLRNVADNFVSGLIILIERPIKMGDRIQVEETFGTVVDIRARSTTVRTNDNIDIIIPNSQIISEQVTNLSHQDLRVRFSVPVGVHYTSDVRLVEKALLEAVAVCPNVLKEPSPVVRFLHFGDSSLDFVVNVWTETLYDRPKALISEVNFAIWDAFAKHQISIPYPQRDIYVKELPRQMLTETRDDA